MKQLVQQYYDFQNQFGQTSELVNCENIINNLFSEDFKKIANGQTLVSKRDELEKQLEGVKELAGDWKMIETTTIVAASDNECVIRYLLETQKAGTFDVMAIMSSLDGNTIHTIDEIYYHI